MITLVLLGIGVVAAALGGELFVRGSVGVAARARVPPGIIAATVAAFATSSPELSVAVSAAVAGQPEIALGDALGSNVVNIGLVLGIALLLAGMTASRRDLRRDLPLAFAAPLLISLLSLDGHLGRLDGVVLVTVFGGWLAVTVRQALHARSMAGDILGEHDSRLGTRDMIIGLVLLIVSGRLLVTVAKTIGESLGWDVFVVGAILVAVATSAPELATTAMARIRGHDEVGVGTVIGSNIFNTLWIVGLTAIIRPIRVVGAELTVAIVAASGMVLVLVPGSSNRLGRWRGALLVTAYGVYVVVLIGVHRTV